MAGVLCAYFLKQKGVDYVLVEASEIGSGITKNTTAKITSQHGLIYETLLSKFGKEKARMYLDANNKALKEFQKLCNHIDCDFTVKDSFVYSLNDRASCEKEIRALERLSYNVEFLEELPLPFTIQGAVKFKEQAEFHPLKFLYGIAKDLTIYEHTKVKEVLENIAITKHGCRGLEEGK